MELDDILLNRRTFYSLLARIFRTEADDALLGALKGVGFPEKTGDPALDAGYAKLRGWLAHPGEDPVTDLAVDYARVFLGAGVSGRDAAYPYESVYTSPEGLVMQDAWEDVCRIYRAHGLERPEKCDVHEDHVAMELDFMATLADDALVALKKEDGPALVAALTTSLEFAKQHLLNWLPGFTRDVKRCAAESFYPAAADITLAFTTLDAGMVESLIEDLTHELEAAGAAGTAEA